MGLKPAFAVAATFKEGIYTSADLDVSPSNNYTIKNVSKTDSVRILIFDEYQKDMQTVKLEPDSIENDDIMIQPNDIIVIAGNGEVIITPKSS
jgi:hypothetical protein